MDRLELNINGNIPNAVLGHWIAAIIIAMPDTQRAKVLEELQKVVMGAVPMKETNGVLHQ